MILIAYNMWDKFDKYWESMGKINKMLIVASILDHRAKMDFAKLIFEIIFNNDSSKIAEMTKAVKDLLNDLYNAYRVCLAHFIIFMLYCIILIQVYCIMLYCISIVL